MRPRTDPDTTPITAPPPGRYGAPVPAPNTPTECPRCGAPAISRAGVAKHELHHREQDVDARRQKALLLRLEQFLDDAESLSDAEGNPQKFGDWKREVDDILAELPESATLEKLHGLSPEGAEALVALASAEPVEATLEHAEAQIIPWPGDLTAEPDDDRDPDEIIPSSATHSFPGDPTPAAVPDLPGYDFEPDPEPGAIAPHATPQPGDDDWDRP